MKDLIDKDIISKDCNKSLTDLFVEPSEDMIVRLPIKYFTIRMDINAKDMLECKIF